jgi:prolyl-tRNA editing enzyme YbaK/EbsC (Cys-tRNA(Pro) deacylase)
MSDTIAVTARGHALHPHGPPEDDDAVEARVLAAVADVAHEVMRIDPALADTAAFCEAYGVPLEDSANCILVASRDDPPVVAACLVLATTRLDVNKRVRKLLGVRRLSFAPAELTRELTGMEIGGVTPFALPDGLPLLIDQRVMERDEVVVGGGSRAIKLRLPPAGLRTLADAEVVDDLAMPG